MNNNKITFRVYKKETIQKLEDFIDKDIELRRHWGSMSRAEKYKYLDQFQDDQEGES